MRRKRLVVGGVVDKFAFEILEKLHAMYSTATSQLIAYTVGLVGVVGILVPTIVTIAQNRAFKREGEAIAKGLEDEAAKIREELKKTLVEDLRKEIEESEKRLMATLTKKEVELKMSLANADGGVFHVQALMHDQRDYHFLAAISYATSASQYLSGGDERNLRIVIDNLIRTLEKVKKSEIESDEQLETTIGALSKGLDANDVNGRYTDSIRNIKREFKEAKNRT